LSIFRPQSKVEGSGTETAKAEAVCAVGGLSLCRRIPPRIANGMTLSALDGHEEPVPAPALG
jgi:hypothetical protein